MRAMMASVCVLGVVAWGAAAQAQEAVGVDVEVDPLAYALEGHSLHAGAHFGRWRADLGSFALRVPAALHGQRGFSQSFTGFGTKLDWFVTRPRGGWFVGAELGLLRSAVTHDETHLSRELLIVTAGGRVGYRWELGAGFYVSPWVGVGYGFGPGEVRLGDQTFERAGLTVFPTIHLGYQAR